MTEQKDLGNTSMGMPPNMAAGLSYMIWAVTGVVFFLLEKENKFVRFHAMQSILLSCVWFVVFVACAVIPIIGWILFIFLQIAFVIIWIILLIKAFSGEQFKLPVLGDIAEKNA